MPELNRRFFLKMAGAAGLVPVLPALPAAASGGATSSQMLWASLYARAGSAQGFAGVTQTMGLSGQAAQGVYAKVIGSHALAAQGATQLSRVVRPAPAVVAAPSSAKAVNRRSIAAEIDRFLAEDEDDLDEPDVLNEMDGVEAPE